MNSPKTNAPAWKEAENKEFPQLILRCFLKNGGRFKRLRQRLKRKPNANLYEFKRECLAEFEQLSEMV